MANATGSRTSFKRVLPLGGADSHCSKAKRSRCISIYQGRGHPTHRTHRGKGKISIESYVIDVGFDPSADPWTREYSKPLEEYCFRDSEAVVRNIPTTTKFLPH